MKWGCHYIVHLVPLYKKDQYKIFHQGASWSLKKFTIKKILISIVQLPTGGPHHHKTPLVKLGTLGVLTPPPHTTPPPRGRGHKKFSKKI